MFILHLLQVLSAATPRSAGHARFNEKFSLIPPHVSANGKEEFFNFLNEYSNKTRSRRDHTQLGYEAPDSFAAIVSKNAFTPREYEVAFEFGMSLAGKGSIGSGFGFWLTTDIQNEPANYGRGHGFQGVGVVIDLENGPQAKFVEGGSHRKGGVTFKHSPEDSYKVILQRKAKVLTAKFVQNGKETVLYSGSPKMPRDVYLGMTSYSGKTSSTLRIERVITNTSNISSKDEQVVKDKGGRGIYIILIGIVATLGLVYYLLQKKPKELIFKK